MGRKVTICDSLFTQYSHSASLREENVEIFPTYFQWEWNDCQTARFVTDSDLRRAKGKGQVAWLLEPEDLHPENYQYLRDNPDKFDAVLVPSQDSRIPNALWYPFGGSSIAPYKWGMYKKTKFMSILLSDKNSMPGHKLRQEIVRRYGQYIDVYNNIPNKVDALKDYQFSVIIESTSRPGYFTEKLLDCLAVGTIPLYFGSLLYGITALQFNTADYFYDMLFQLKKTPDFYKNMTRQFHANFVQCKAYMVCEDSIYLMYRELFE